VAAPLQAVLAISPRREWLATELPRTAADDDLARLAQFLTLSRDGKVVLALLVQKRFDVAGGGRMVFLCFRDCPNF